MSCILITQSCNGGPYHYHNMLHSLRPLYGLCPFGGPLFWGWVVGLERPSAMQSKSTKVRLVGFEFGWLKSCPEWMQCPPMWQYPPQGFPRKENICQGFSGSTIKKIRCHKTFMMKKRLVVLSGEGEQVPAKCQSPLRAITLPLLGLEPSGYLQDPEPRPCIAILGVLSTGQESNLTDYP